MSLRVSVPVIYRLLARVDVTPTCWLWPGSTTTKGYGTIGITRKTLGLTHRIVYEYFVGPIPPRHHIDHLCRVRHCVNPDHLEAVTPAENVRRQAEARVTASHCAAGHAWTSANTYEGPSVPGRRRCRLCRNAYQRRRYAARKAAA